jgi:hypothetical protein
METRALITTSCAWKTTGTQLFGQQHHWRVMRLETLIQHLVPEEYWNTT